MLIKSVEITFKKLAVARLDIEYFGFISLQKEFTPLHVAAKHGRLGVAALLLRHLASPDATAQVCCNQSVMGNV